MTHTPGPWVFNGHHIYGPKHEDSKHPNGRVFVASVARGVHRADPLLDGGADRFSFDSEADVRLIAAAPDLLTATEAWVAAMDKWLETGIPSTPDESKAIYEAAVAAVKKARGL